MSVPPTAFTEDNVPQAPEDPLFGLMAAYRKDTSEKKVDLGIGAYRDDNAKPWVLPVVKKVSAQTKGAGSVGREKGRISIRGWGDEIGG